MRGVKRLNIAKYFFRQREASTEQTRGCKKKSGTECEQEDEEDEKDEEDEIEEEEEEEEVNDRSSTLLARRCRVSVIRDSVRANLAREKERVGGKIIYRLPAHGISAASVRRRILTVNAKHVGRPCRGISCFGRWRRSYPFVSPKTRSEIADELGVFVGKTARPIYRSPHSRLTAEILAPEYLAGRDDAYRHLATTDSPLP